MLMTIQFYLIFCADIFDVVGQPVFVYVNHNFLTYDHLNNDEFTHTFSIYIIRTLNLNSKVSLPLHSVLYLFDKQWFFIHVCMITGR